MKAEVPIIEEVAGAIVGNASSVRSAVTTTIIVARYIYEKMTKLPVYTPEELENYRELTSLYIEYVDSKIPDEWELEVKGGKAGSDRSEYRPTYDHNFAGKGQDLIADRGRVRTNTVSIDQYVTRMLTEINFLFHSLSKRSVAPLRRGSVEGMFFTELFYWILQELPRMNFKTQGDFEKIIKIRNYCERVSSRVLLRPSDTVSYTMGALEIIIDNFNNIIEPTKKLIQVNAFNDRVERLDNAIVGMTSETFHMMYLMIQGEHGYEIRLPVDLFLDEKQQHRPEIHAFKKQRLAYWLQETLIRLGIKGGDFIAHMMIDLSEIDTHLEGECYGDRHLVLPPELVDAPSHKSWGHWSFLIQNNMSMREAPVPVKSFEEMAAILRKTREVYRGILRIYYFQRFLRDLRVNFIYGDVWLYGDSAGRTVVDAVLTIVAELSQELMGSLSQLFEQDIYKHFRAKVGSAGIGAKESGFLAMEETATLYDRVKTYFQRARRDIGVIKVQVSEYESGSTRPVLSKQDVLEDLIRFLEYRGRQGTSVYQALKLALDPMSGPATVVCAAPAIGTAVAGQRAIAAQPSVAQSLSFAPGVSVKPVAPEAAAVGGRPGLFHAPASVAAPPQKSAEVTSDAATSKELKQSAKGTCSVM